MKFEQELLAGRLIRRYKRFLADIELEDHETITVHCPNSGSMQGCSDPGSQVLLSRSANPKRKYPHTLEMVRAGSVWVGVNTALTNKLVHEALENGIIEEFNRPDTIRPEVKTSASTRLDFLLECRERQVYVEVKNCSLAEDGRAMFPDAVTARGTKHLRELAGLKREGYGAAVLFCVQRGDADYFAPAAHIDPLYAETLSLVHEAGVMVLAYQADVSPGEILVARKIPVQTG